MRRYSKRWESERAARKERRAGMPMKPRDNLGFIVCDLVDREGVVPQAGRKFDTVRAYKDALYRAELEAREQSERDRKRKQSENKKKEKAA